MRQSSLQLRESRGLSRFRDFRISIRHKRISPTTHLRSPCGRASSRWQGLVALDGVRRPGAGVDLQVVGLVMWRDEFIEHLYVLPGHRSHGMGAALLAGAAERMPTERISLWTFLVNVNAVGFSLSQGFRIDRASDGQADEERLADFLLTRAQPGPGVIAGVTSSSSQTSPKP